MRGSDVGGPGHRRGAGRRWPVVVVAVFAAIVGFLIPQLVQSRPIPDLIPVNVSSSRPAAAPATGAFSVPTTLKAVPVYYVGRQDGLLYREFRDLASHGGLAETAVAALLEVAPLDPDYESWWASAPKLSVEQTGETVTVNLPLAAFSKVKSQEQARLAVTQLVYTVTAALGDPAGALSVRITVDGSPTLPPLFPSDKGFQRSGLAPMPSLWITSPQNQASLAEGAVTVRGTKKVSAGVPQVIVVDAGSGRQVGSWVATADGESVGWALWKVEIQLTSGTYEIRASVHDGSAVYSENKTIKVSAPGQ